MNQELRQRIIGAIVITALAAIFIPMLFDDPIDDSGQTVSELAIPDDNQANVVEDVSPLPSNAVDVLKPNDTANPNETNSAALSELQAPSDEGLEPEQLPTEEEANKNEESPVTTGLDTGEVDETPVIKQPTGNIDATVKPSHKPINAAPQNTTHSTVKVKAKPSDLSQTNLDESAVVKPMSPADNTPAQNQHWSVQAGSFSKKENALAMQDTLRKLNLPVTVEKTGSLYRLKVGSHLSKKQALALKAKLEQSNIQNLLLPE